MEHKSVHLIHFNDVYDINKASPFVQRIRKAIRSHTIHIFSGDLFYPSLESTVMHGAQMIKVMQECGVQYAVPGNHDIEIGEEHFTNLINQMSVKWTLCNYRNKATGVLLGNCSEYEIIEREGVRVGIFGLIDTTWVETSAIKAADYELDDFLMKGKEMSRYLRAEGCDLVIAVTHMANEDDSLLLTDDNDIDIVLGGHEHSFMVKRDNEKILLKSRTNF